MKNNTDKYTSKELSQKLKEAGCEIKSEHSYYRLVKGKKIPFAKCDNKGNWEQAYATEHETTPMYDIMWDICVKYAGDFFYCQQPPEYNKFGICGHNVKEAHAFYIISLLQDGKKSEAELYIWNNTVFNPKNKVEE